MGLRVLEMRTLFLLLVLFLRAHFGKAEVSYDHRSLIVNGQRRILISGSIHYPRSTPNMWPDLIDKAKQGGLDAIETYVFWSGHEPQPGKYYFEDRYDLVKFIKLVHEAGLYAILRIGPYVCAEYNFGGFPVWLKYVPGISFRTDNKPFKDAMEKFTKKIVSMMKEESLFESQGGPIILSQIENEYDAMEPEVGAPGKIYAQWAANMAVGLNTGVPWIMCKQQDAPSPVINTCNGFYCQSFNPNNYSKPKIWTEAWSGWFDSFGSPVSHRPAEDLAFAAALFFQNGGALMNYYMYHGGTNFGRTAGGPFITTSYDYDAPIDEYGLIRQPKWGHLKNLHAAIKQCEPALVSGDPNITHLGSKIQEAHVFDDGKGLCAAFLTNYDLHSTATVTFRGVSYSLPRWSVSVLPDCKKVVYNTAQISDKITSVEMTTVERGFKWKSYSEVATSEGKNSFTKNALLDQLNTTWDKTDYLWYTTKVNIDSSEKNGSNPFLTVSSFGDVLYVFINGVFLGTDHGIVDHPRFVFRPQVKMKLGVNSISLLSVGAGLPNIGRFFEQRSHGVYAVTLEGLDGGKRNLANQKWTYKIGMDGESSSLHTRSGTTSVQWFKDENLATKTPLTWYKASFRQPSGDEPLALNMESMGKGQVWINGQNIGRYWNEKASGDCATCDYAGWYHENKCSTGCGEPSQKWYHVPRSWLNRTRNLVVVFEEMGGDPGGITLAKRHAG